MLLISEIHQKHALAGGKGHVYSGGDEVGCILGSALVEILQNTHLRAVNVVFIVDVTR